MGMQNSPARSSIDVGSVIAGTYTIEALIGRGGMGAVFLASHNRLPGKQVAIKVLHAELSHAIGAQRFLREIKLTASLQHPHILPIHDSGQAVGQLWYSMPYVAGQSLRERLARDGTIPVDEALRLAREVAVALDYAHRQGIVHRDLKPGNIMLTKSGAKLLDFGLAKSAAPAVMASGAAGETATIASPPVTREGTVVGTFNYMSPEQVEGREADARSDIFALGCVLYEMSTGKRAFEGKSSASIVAAVLERDPEPISTLRPASPPALDHVVNTCLAKDPDERWQSASDVKRELLWIAGGSGASAVIKQPRISSSSKFAMILGTVAVLGLGVAIGVFIWGLRKTEPEQAVVAQIVIPDNLELNSLGDTSGAPSLSPDGTHIVFSAADTNGIPRLYLRSLDSTAVTSLPGTENSTFPFWSPDSHSIAFFGGGKLKRIEIAGGTPVNICDAAVARGGSWGADGTIIFAPTFNSGIWKVDANGGTPEEVVKVDLPRHTTYRWPWFLPGGKKFLYLAANHNQPTGPDSKIYIASLDGKENQPVLQNPANAIYASGYLLYVRGTALVAQKFDAGSGRTTSDAKVVADDVQLDGSIWRGTVTASDTGLLLFQTGGAAAHLQLTWFDRAGKQLGEIKDQEAFWQVAISPDDKKLALDMGDLKGWVSVYDIARKTSTRLTFANENVRDPVWSADGQRIAYSRQVLSGGTAGLYSKLASGTSGAVELMAPIEDTNLALCDWSRDGKYLIYRRGASGQGNGVDLWILPLFGNRKPFLYASGVGDQTHGQFSPDGRWIAYASNESGRFEVYVAPFPWTGAKWQVSTDVAEMPRWRRDGKELFFQADGDTGVMAAAVSATGSSFEIGEVHRLFRARMELGYQGQSFVSSSNGERFAVITHGKGGSAPPVLIQKWTALLNK